MINLTPLEEHEVVQHASHFAEAVSTAVQDLCGISFTLTGDPHSTAKELSLNDITVFTNFTGTVQGNYSLNIDQHTASAILGLDQGADFDSYACGLFEEVVNVAVGKVIENLKTQFGFLTFNSPVFSMGKIRFPGYRSCNITMRSELGTITVNFAINMANLEITDKLLKTMKNLRKQQSISYHDALTGIYNRAYFEYFKNKIFGNKRPLSIVLFDVDKFKDINDTFGHSAGDLSLVRIAKVVSDNVRDTDIPIRFGGDEFIILLEESPLVGALRLIERIVAGLNRAPVELENGNTITIQISAGIAEHNQGETFEQLFEKADANLYKAKKAGRNQICSE